MRQIWAVARQMIAEGIRMKLALVFLGMLGVVVIGLPFSVAGDNSLTGRVQTFMTYGLASSSVLLGMLTIFMSRSLSDEFVNKQILMVMTKPVPRWQFLLGKWLGMTLLNATFLLFAAVSIYGMVYYIKWTYPPLNEYDLARLENEVLVARHATRHTPPDFRKMAEREFQRRLELGVYPDDDPQFGPEERERATEDLRRQEEWYWRVVGPEDVRELHFERILCDRSKDKEIQLRYRTEVTRAPWDEIYRGRFVFGDLSKDTNVVEVDVRHVIARYHTVTAPADCVAADGSLLVTFINKNFRAGEPGEHPWATVMEFRPTDDPEVLFVVGSFWANYGRLLVLIMCKLMFLAAVSVLTTTVFSYPVACLASFTVYILAATRSFMSEALDMASSRAGSMFESLPEFAIGVVTTVYNAIFWVIPDFGKYDAIENFVDGQNVTLVWTLQGFFELTLLSGVALGLAMLLFHRREVAEVSV